MNQLQSYSLWNRATQQEERFLLVTDGSMLTDPGPDRIWVQLLGDAVDMKLQAVNGKPAEVSRLSPAELLQAAKDARWAAAKAMREQRELGGCTTPKGPVQTDAASQRRIDITARRALEVQTNQRLRTLIKTIAASSFSEDWLMMNDKPETHDATEMLALADAVTTHVTACHEASQAIRAKIDAATTIDAVNAVSITAGYPNNP